MCTAYADARKLSLSRVSTIVFGDGKVLSRLEGNSDLTTSRYEAAMQWLSANWPEGIDWPVDVVRPDVRGEAA
ncbi:hypothetical protein [Limoniibacter endophyticus]|uniref:hypothetical protein n=1 Tax=Limoniibacter endophyticus TaxID=1565040 RepID=UPI003618FCE0